MADPAETFITELPQVKAVRVVRTAASRISEIHVISSTDKTAKQTVRDIQTVLTAALGITIDHRIVSVVRFDRVFLDEMHDMRERG